MIFCDYHINEIIWIIYVYTYNNLRYYAAIQDFDLGPTQDYLGHREPKHTVHLMLKEFRKWHRRRR